MGGGTVDLQEYLLAEASLCLQKDNVSSGTKFKESKEAERRSQAGNRAAWNTLFMRSDTVAEAVAAHYGITKSQLLSREAADLPVRMALGEAHVIAMTKKALGDAGVLKAKS